MINHVYSVINHNGSDMSLTFMNSVKNCSEGFVCRLNAVFKMFLRTQPKQS